jgi:hypothetical protein
LPAQIGAKKSADLISKGNVMTHSGMFSMRLISHRGVRLWAALVLSAVMALAVAAGPSAPKAHASGAEYFCSVLAAPNGNCFGTAHNLTWVRAYGYQYSACSNAYQGGFVAGWACAPAGNWSNSYFDGSRYMTPVVHNNSAGNQNQLWGYQEFL